MNRLLGEIRRINWRKPKKKRRLLAAGLGLLIFLAPLSYLTLQAPEAALADSLLKFDEGYGTTVNDSSGTASGTITGATWKTDDLCMNQMCLFFDGTDWISFGDEASFDFAAATDFTIEFWFRHGAAAAAEVIVQKYEGTGGDGGYRIQMESDGDISFGVDDANGGFADDNIVTTAANYDDNRWHHVTAVKDGTTGIYLYIDSVLIVSDTTIGSTGTLANDDTFYIGDSNGADGGDEYIGFLDEVKIYTSTARSQTEINADVLGVTTSRGTAASFGPDKSFLSEGLVGYWPMDETSGNATDASGNATTLTNTATTTFSGAKFANGAEPNGTTQYFDAVDNADLSVTGALTLSAWIEPDDTTGSQDIVGKWDGANESYLLAMEGANLRMYIDSSSNYEATTGTPLTGNTMTHVAGVYDSATQSVILYVNGVIQTSSTTGTIPSSIGDDAGEFTIGAEDSSGTAANFFGGHIDDVRIYNRAFSPAEIRQLADWGPGPVGYWPMDENSGTASVNDRSGSDNTGTMNGSMTQDDWVPGQFGSALDFDGSDDYVEITSGGVVEMGTSDWTISTWINTSVNGDHIVSKVGFGCCGGSIDDGYALKVDSSGYLDMKFSVEGGPYQGTTADGATVDDGNWHHVAGVWDRDGNMIRYVDGQQTGTQDDISSYSATDITDTNHSLTIGQRPPDIGILNFNGVIDEVRVYNYVRTPSHIIEDMNAGHPAPGSPIGSPIGWWKFDEGFGVRLDTVYDSSGQGNDGTLNGASSNEPDWVSPVNCKLGKCLDFDPANSEQVNIGDIAAYDLGDTDDVTLTGWFNRDTFAADHTIVSKRSGTTDSDQGYTVYLDDTNDTLIFEICDATSTCDEYQLESSTSFTSTGWNYFAVIWDQDSAGNSEIYINGVDDNATDTGVIGDIGDASNALDFRIGIEDGNTNDFDGRLDEIKIYNFALTPAQVAADYNRASAASFGGVLADQDQEGFSLTHPVLEYLFNENAGDTAFDTGSQTSSDPGDGTLGSAAGADANDPTWIPVSGAPRHARSLSGGALAFDGSNDYIDANNPSKLGFGDTDDFTLEAWINRESATTDDIIMEKRGNFATTSNGFTFWIDDTNDDINFEVSDGTGGGSDVYTIDGTSTITTSGWHHVVAVFDESSDANSTVFLDGVDDKQASVGTITDVGSLSNSRDFRVGVQDVSDANPFDGSMDSIRVYNYALTPAQAVYAFNRGKPLGYWKLDDCTGTNADDSGSGDNDGTITIGGSGDNTTPGTCSGSSGEAWFAGATGKRNASLDFDGTDDYATIANESDFDFERTDAFSVSAWINPDDWDSQGIVNKAEGSGDIRGWALNLADASGTPRVDEVGFALRNSSSSNLQVRTLKDFTGSAGSWLHVAATYDGSSTPSGINIYVNGVNEPHDSVDDTLSSTILQDISPQISGRGGANFLFNGQIDEVKIFNYVLTADQIKRDFNYGAQFFGPNTGP